MSSILVTIALIFVVFLGLIIFDSLVYLKNGSNFKYLIQTRFYEISPLRSLFWIIFISFGTLFLLKSAILLNLLYRIIFQEERISLTINEAIITGIITLSLFAILWLFNRFILTIPSIPIIKVGIDKINLRYGIYPRLLQNLGIEKIPNEIATKRDLERSIRQLIAFIGVVSIIAVVYFTIKNEELYLDIDLITPIELGLSSDFSFLTLIGLILLLTIPTLIIVLMFDNRDYTFWDFQQSLIAQLGLLTAMIFSFFCLEANLVSIGILSGIILGIYGFRAIADLQLESKYRRVKRVYNPIADKIREHTPYLSQIADDPQLKLKPLNSTEIAHRIGKGCQNTESLSLLVVRNFARFLDLVEVQYQDFAVAVLRYLTVRRYVTLSGGSATFRCLQHPRVPMWDYSLFPLKPPTGYADWIDPLSLPSRWNVVKTCSNCGGTGRVARTETETKTDSNGNTTTRTRTVYETCSTCGGSGRLEYTQILNTKWQKFIPSVTEPNIPVPELVENAEETILLQSTHYRKF